VSHFLTDFFWLRVHIKISTKLTHPDQHMACKAIHHYIKRLACGRV